MDITTSLLHSLADGRFHSGEELARSLGITRTAVWKQVHRLDRYGLEIRSVHGKGYCLAFPVELLDVDRIRSALPGRTAAQVREILVALETDSTNQRLVERIRRGPIHGWVMFAEYQSAGRGRRGTAWISPVGAGISMSLGWRFETPPEPMNALSLAAGVAAVAALTELGLDGIYLKWPNDIIWEGRKLGGILIEAQGETAGPYDIVLGIGINVCLPPRVFAMIEQPVADIFGITGQVVSRNRLAAALISQMVDMLTTYGSRGFPAFIERWRALDYFRDREAALLLADATLTGRVLGISPNGLLSMSIDGEPRLFSSGELSLRALD